MYDSLPANGLMPESESESDSASDSEMSGIGERVATRAEKRKEMDRVDYPNERTADRSAADSDGRAGQAQSKNEHRLHKDKECNVCSPKTQSSRRSSKLEARLRNLEISRN